MNVVRKISLIGIAGVALLSSVALAAVPAFAEGETQNITVNNATVTQADIGTCGNTWAMGTFKKSYRLEQNSNGTYNLSIDYGNGTFVTIPDPKTGVTASPGACGYGGRGLDTVASGIIGTMTEEWNTTVTATRAPNGHPDCAANNGCTKASDFLAAVFGVANATPDPDWKVTGSYTTQSNGSWFDTSDNYPFRDTGDITGSL